MPPLSLAEASQASGKSRSSLWRYIKSGRLSASRLEDGSYVIDPAELARCFPPEKPHPSHPRSDEQGDEKAEKAALEAENAQLKERLADKDTQIADLRGQRESGSAKRRSGRTGPKPGLLRRLFGH